MSANSAAAAGSRVMSQAAALECGQESDGVRVNSILLDHENAVPSEVAAAVIYLASDESRFMTAGEIALDGDGSTA
jgi:NAD(P)-dependent dehydrogenase (short-subunit alcohol dehydrogenase family)